MDARIDVIGHQSFTDDDSIFEVISMPWHEGHQDVSSKSKFTTIRGGTVGNRLAFLDHIAAANDRSLVEQR